LEALPADDLGLRRVVSRYFREKKNGFQVQKHGKSPKAGANGKD